MGKEDTDVSSLALSLLVMGGSVDRVLLRFQTLEVGATSPLRDRVSPLLLPTTAPLVVEGGGLTLRPLRTVDLIPSPERL